MSDDFGTVNYRRGDKSHFARHRQALEELLADAPNEQLANEYRRLIQQLDGVATPAPGRRPDATAEAAVATRELIATPAVELPESEVEPRSRLPLIIVFFVLALGAIGWLIWRASNDRVPKESTVVESTAATTTTAAAETTAPTPPPPTSPLVITPPQHDYGVIRKGTRATRQFEVANRSDGPITIQLARSQCKCLFYEYQALIPPKNKESVTVTVDGARAPAGALRETIRVSVKSDAAAGTTFDVIATIR